MDPDIFSKAMEKLFIHGGSVVDYSDNASAGHNGWRKSYSAQADRRRAQIELVLKYAESSQCRMSALVHHFGDMADGAMPADVRLLRPAELRLAGAARVVRRA